MKSKIVKKLIMYTLILVSAYFFGAGVSWVIHNNVKKPAMKIQDTENWGLGFSTEGKPPTGNATPDELKEYDTYFIGDTAKNKIYLTFDAGFENGNMPAILEALKKHKAKATFFVVGNFIESSPDLLKKMVADGHTIGNHTYHHPDMSSISSMESFQKEIDDLANLYEKTTGKKLTKFYRPPQGKYSTENLQMAQKLGYKTFFWSLAYVDWYQNAQPTKEEAFSKLLTRIHPGAIVLLHSTSSTNAQILDELLTKWEEMGYSFGTLGELCGMKSASSEQKPTKAPITVTMDPVS